MLIFRRHHPELGPRFPSCDNNIGFVLAAETAATAATAAGAAGAAEAAEAAEAAGVAVSFRLANGDLRCPDGAQTSGARADAAGVVDTDGGLDAGCTGTMRRDDDL